MSENVFKKCGACKYIWNSLDEFIHDKNVKVLWLQVIPGFPHANCIIFEHKGCGSTISVLTIKLHSLLKREFDFTDDLYGTEKCNDFCNTRDTMAACDKKCVNARDRELARMLVSLKWADQ